MTNEQNTTWTNLTQKHPLYKQFIAWACNGCSTATLLIHKQSCSPRTDSRSQVWLCKERRKGLDLRASCGYTQEAEKLERNDSKINLGITLKNSATKKLRLRVWAHSRGEYLYILSRQGLTLRHKTYSISQQDNDLFRIRKQSVLWGVWHIGSKRRRHTQKGGFLTVGAILGSLAGPALEAIAGPVIKKYLVEKSNVATADMLRQKSLLRRHEKPQPVTFSNGQSFLARYEEVNRKNLSRNVIITRARQMGPRRRRKRKTQKSGSLLGNIVNLGASALTSTGLLKRGIVIGVKALNSDLRKN